MKINFTKEHYTKLQTLAFEMLVSNTTIQTKLGMPLNIVELMHTQTINTLGSIRVSLSKQIEDLENQDEWSTSDTQQLKLESLRKKKELVNLIIGWKKYNLELSETRARREKIEKELKALKESQKTPEDKIKELEAELSGLNETF